MEKVGEGSRQSAGGFVSSVSYYEAKKCEGCSLKSMCHNAKCNRRIEINHRLNRHKERVRKLLTSKEGFYHRSMRPIEPESVFGQGKSNKQYNLFRHFSSKNDKVMMDFAIFAIAFNIGKLYNYLKTIGVSSDETEIAELYRRGKKWVSNHNSGKDMFGESAGWRFCLF